MSNAFDKLMDPNNKPDEVLTSNAGGRPMHDQWFGYERVYIDGKACAKCRNCSKTYANTHQVRLSKHR